MEKYFDNNCLDIDLLSKDYFNINVKDIFNIFYKNHFNKLLKNKVLDINSVKLIKDLKKDLSTIKGLYKTLNKNFIFLIENNIIKFGEKEIVRKYTPVDNNIFLFSLDFGYIYNNRFEYKNIKIPIDLLLPPVEYNNFTPLGFEVTNLINNEHTEVYYEYYKDK